MRDKLAFELYKISFANFLLSPNKKALKISALKAYLVGVGGFEPPTSTSRT